MRLFSALLLLSAGPALGDLVLLDAPAAVCPTQCILLTGRYAAYHTIAADSARADIVGRVVLVEQPAYDDGGCPSPRAPSAALAAAAGAVGWLTVDYYPELAIVIPGYYAYQLGGEGDRALLAAAPPAVDLGQTGAGRAGLSWLVDSAKAGAAPRVALRVRERDPYLAARLSGWAAFCRALVIVFSLAVLELAVCRIYALVARPCSRKMSSADAPSRPSATRTSVAAIPDPPDASAVGRLLRPWGIGVIVLVLAASSAAVQVVNAAIDPLYAYGILGKNTDLFLYNTPIVCAIGSQSIHLVYVHESIGRGGIETLMLFGGWHKALLVTLVALYATAELVLVVTLSSSSADLYALDMALFVGMPALLMCVCAFLNMRARYSDAISASARARIAAKLRLFALGNALILGAGLAWMWLYAPIADVVIFVVTSNGYNSVLYLQIELVEPVGIRTPRGPLRVLFELARAKLWRRRAARGLARGSPSSKSKRIAPQLDSDGRSDPAALSERARDGVVGVPCADDDDDSGRRDGTSGATAESRGARRDASPSAHLPSRSGDLDAHLGLGVSLACLRDFAREQSVSSTTTTSELVRAVQQLTAASRRSFAEQLARSDASDGLPAVGRATVFVSHAQTCSFAKLLAALDSHKRLHQRGANEMYFWLDLMCIRQHEVAADVLRIGEVINSIGCVTVVLDPWHKPVCLERVWCLYEIAQTVGDVSRALDAPSVPSHRDAPSDTARSSGDDPTLAPAVHGPMPEEAPQTDGRAGAAATPVGRSQWLQVARSQPQRGGNNSMFKSSSRVKAGRDLEDEQRAPARLLLTMSPDERLKLVQAARSSHQQLERALTRFDCRTAKASVEADRQRILGYIATKYARPQADAADAADAAQMAAYLHFNRRVQSAIREAVAALSHLRADERGQP